ncbi:MAG: FtsQ-type POTRA domain-containing protein [Alphaproteobacteria bacterium]|nr:FtsQ-type POTRA domain-containing protein [Alphaproteobacteria bacterium]
MASKRKNTKSMRAKGIGLFGKTKKKQKRLVKSKGARKSTMTQKRKNANKSEAMLASFKKLSVVTLIFLLLVWAMGWYILSDGPARTVLWLHRQTISVSAELGFTVHNILVEGRNHTDPDALLAIINVREGDPVFSFIPHEAKKQIERIGWVKSAYVERRLPDTIYIHLFERKPVALWMNDNVLSLVDAGGNVITQEGLKQFKDLMMVQGSGAPEKTSALITLLGKAPALGKMIDHAVLVDGRRWDLILPDDKRIKLPEQGADKAIAHIMERYEKNKLLTKETVIEIDARYKDRLIVRTRLGDVQDYKAGVK